MTNRDDRASWRRVEARESELAWLAGHHSDDIGYDPTGWEASTWVLHAMYEPVSPSAPRPLEVAPWWGAEHPGAGWNRLLWSDDVRRHGQVLSTEDADWPTLWLHRDDASWGPDEGTLDHVSWSAMVDVLAHHGGGEVDCVAYFDPLAAQERLTPGPVWAGPLDAITSLVTEAEYQFSPTNWWLADRSWFVWTDYDEWATKVSGSEELIHAVEAHPDIECIRWTGPDGRGGRSWEERERALRPTRAPSRFSH